MFPLQIRNLFFYGLHDEKIFEFQMTANFFSALPNIFTSRKKIDFFLLTKYNYSTRWFMHYRECHPNRFEISDDITQGKKIRIILRLFMLCEPESVQISQNQERQ